VYNGWWTQYALYVLHNTVFYCIDHMIIINTCVFQVWQSHLWFDYCNTLLYFLSLYVCSFQYKSLQQKQQTWCLYMTGQQKETSTIHLFYVNDFSNFLMCTYERLLRRTQNLKKTWRNMIMFQLFLYGSMARFKIRHDVKDVNAN
jgi:hypothetical protein